MEVYEEPYMGGEEYGFDYEKESMGDFDEDVPESLSEVSEAEIEEREQEEFDIPDDEERFGVSFKDLERTGGRGDEKLMEQEDYIIRNLSIILSSQPFNIKISQKDKEAFKSIPNLKIRNPFMLACIIAWRVGGFLEREDDLKKFYSKYGKGLPKKEFMIDFIRYLTFSKKR